MIGWVVLSGTAEVGRLEAPDRPSALARARQRFGFTVSVQSAASYQIMIEERSATYRRRSREVEDGDECG